MWHSCDNVGQRGAQSCSCACAQELKALEAVVDQLKSEMEARMQQQEQALGRTLTTLVSAVETLTAKMDRQQPAAGARASVLEPGTADAAQSSGASSTPAPARAHSPAPAPAVAPTLVADAPPALHAPAASGDADTVRRLLARGDEPTTRDALGNSALHCAAAAGHVAALDALLEAAEARAPEAARAQRAALAANARGQKFRTPLHAAAKAGHTDAACSLLAAGARPDAADAEGVTPLHLAVWKGHHAVAALLLAEGATVDAVSKDALTPLDTAALSGHAPLVQLLLEKGADHQRRDTQQFSVLHHAAAGGDPKTVLILLEKGLDVQERNAVGLTALHIAATKGHVEVMEILLENGADIDAGAEDGDTPLLLAALGGHADAVEKLLAKGASVKEPVIQLKDSGGGLQHKINLKKMFLVAAAEGGSPNAVKALSISGASVIPLVHQFALERASNADVVWALADVAPENFRQVAEEALSTMAARGNAAALRVVLATGVDVLCERSVSALRSAAENNRAECVSVLIDAGVWDEDHVALHAAVKLGFEKSVSVFLERYMTNKQKNEALGVAKNHSQVEIMRILVEAGANPFVVDFKESWEFVKMCAKQKMHKSTTETL